MFCSTVIPTVGRTSLEHAVSSILDQVFDAAEFEVIVVNDSGQSLPPAAWQSCPQVRIVSSNRRERSFARNVGAAAAKGKYLHFLDDDDWMAPGALQTFWNLSEVTSAAWLYGGAHLLDARNQVKEVLMLGEGGNIFAHIIGGEWIPLQASLIRAREFFAIGGFNPLSTPGEDRDLCNRYALVGEFAFVRSIVAYLDRSSESTTNYALSLTNSRLEREKVLSSPGVRRRLCNSSPSPYWRGRGTRVFLASAGLQIRQGSPVVAFSRCVAAIGCMLNRPSVILHHDFWRAMTHSHNSNVVRDPV